MRKKRWGGLVVALVKLRLGPLAVFVTKGVQVGALKSFLYSTAYLRPARVPQVSSRLFPLRTLLVKRGPAITSTLIVSLSLRAGTPLSVTRTVRLTVPRAEGVQVKDR